MRLPVQKPGCLCRKLLCWQETGSKVSVKPLEFHLSCIWVPVLISAASWCLPRQLQTSSGIYTVLGTIPPVLGSQEVTALLTKGLDSVVGASFAVEPDPFKAAKMMLEHIDKKRKALGLK